MRLNIYLDQARTELYKPSEKQLAFHKSPAKLRLSHGGLATGKTVAAAVEALKCMLQFPGTRGLIGRYTEGELRRTSWYEFKQILPPELIAYENQAQLLIRLHNGSEVMGMMLQEEMKLRSLNIAWFWVDEAIEIPEKVLRQLVARTGRTQAHMPGRGWLTTNPEGRTHYLYRDFIERGKWGHAQFHFRTADASFLKPGYYEFLRESFDEEMVNKLLEGSWDSSEGAVYPMFSREAHVIPWTAADVPREWTRYRAMDHGWSDPAVCLYAAMGPPPENALVIYDAYYRKYRTIRQIVEDVTSLSGEHAFQYTVMDPYRGEATESATGRKIVDEYRSYGLPVTLARRQGIAVGVARVRKLLELEPGLLHLTRGKTGQGAQVRDDGARLPNTAAPRLYICAHCKPLIDEFNHYRYPEGGGETPHDSWNHGLDALRYLVLHNPAYQEAARPDTWQEFLRRVKKEFGITKKQEDTILGNEFAP